MVRNKARLSAAALAVLMCGAMPAAATTINFDDLGTGSYGPSPRASFSDAGFRFSDNTSWVDASGAFGGYGPAHSGSYSALNNYGGAIEMTLDGGGLFDLASFFVKSWGSYRQTTSLTAYRGATAVGQLDYTFTGEWTQIAADFAGIDRVSFNDRSGALLIDDISATPSASAVPEPGTWAMMVVGMGALGFALRRRPAANLLRHTTG